MIGKEVPIDPEKAAGRSKAQQIRDLTDYQRAADEAAKVMYFTTRGFQSETFAGQQLEMIALAMESVRSVQPVKHFIFSFKEGEVPSPEQIEELLDIVEEQYGSTGHQMMAAVHTDTDNVHVHVSLNTVSPRTHQVVKVNNGRSWEFLHQVVALCEHRQGWRREAKGRYVVMENGELAKATEVRAPKPSATALEVENRTGEKSAQRIVLEEAAPILKKAASWADVHDGLAERGMRLERKGSGALLFVGEVPVKLSAAKVGGLAKLCKRLGEFRPRDEALAVPARASEPVREELRPYWDDYIAGRDGHRQEKARRWAELRERKDAERRALADRYKARHAELNSKGLPGVALNVMRSLMAGERAKERLALKERHDREAQALREAFPPWPDHETWLAKWYSPEAAQRYRYQGHVPTGLQGEGETDARPRDLRDFTAEVLGNSVAYRRTEGGAGGVSAFAFAFADHGRNIEVAEADDRAAALAALQLGAAKWGGKVTIYGSPEYQAMCVQLAVENGIEIVNPELREQFRAAKEAHRRAREEAMRTHQAQQFARYHEAVQADRYTLTAIKMTTDKRLARLVGPREGVAAADVYGRMGALIAAHSKRENIYYTPRSDAMHHILVDDLTRASLTRMLADGHKPAAVLESSPDRFQAVLNVPKTGEDQDAERAVANALSARLNKAYGDPNLSGAIHPHRAPGFENHKWEEGAPAPKYQREDGSFPEVNLVFAVPCTCTRAQALAQEIGQQLAEDARQAGERGRAPTPIGTLPSEVYAAHHRDIMARWRGDKPNLSIVDSMIAERMVATGHDEDSVRHAIEACAPSIRARPESRNWADYARRTAEYAAHSPKAAASIAKLRPYLSQLLLLEGRDPAELTHAEPR